VTVIDDATGPSALVKHVVVGALPAMTHVRACPTASLHVQSAAQASIGLLQTLSAQAQMGTVDGPLTLGRAQDAGLPSVHPLPPEPTSWSAPPVDGLPGIAPLSSSAGMPEASDVVPAVIRPPQAKANHGVRIQSAPRDITPLHLDAARLLAPARLLRGGQDRLR
jgi:hypothetical protein